MSTGKSFAEVFHSKLQHVRQSGDKNLKSWSKNSESSEEFKCALAEFETAQNFESRIPSPVLSSTWRQMIPRSKLGINAKTKTYKTEMLAPLMYNNL